MDQNIKKNYIYSVAYQILSMVTPLITIPYVSRIFGAEYLGIYGYTNTVAQYFVLFALLGLANYGNRSIAVVRDNQEQLNRTFSEIYAMQLLTGTAALAVYLVYALLFSGAYRLYSLILTLYVMSACFDVNWLFFGLEKFKTTVTRNFVVKLSTVAAILLLIRSKQDLWLYTTIFAVGMFASNLALWPYVRKEVSWIKPTREGVWKHVKPNLVMFIPVVAVSIYKYMDKLMLGGFSTAEVGYYENVEKIYTVAMGFITAFGSVMLPRMSHLAAKEGMEAAEKNIAVSMRFVMGAAFALAFGIAAVAPEFVGVYFGEGFAPCVIIMIALAPTVIFQSWANVIRTQYLIPFRHDRVYVISVLLGAVINFTVNLLLIRRMGAMGAVVGTIGAEILVAVYQTFAARKQLPIAKYLIEATPYVLIGLLMYAAVRLSSRIRLSSAVLTVAMEVMLGMIIYAVLWGVLELVWTRNKRRRPV